VLLATLQVQSSFASVTALNQSQASPTTTAPSTPTVPATTVTTSTSTSTTSGADTSTASPLTQLPILIGIIAGGVAIIVAIVLLFLRKCCRSSAPKYSQSQLLSVGAEEHPMKTLNDAQASPPSEHAITLDGKEQDSVSDDFEEHTFSRTRPSMKLGNSEHMAESSTDDEPNSRGFVRAIFAYKAQADGEMSFSLGDELEITVKNANGWCYAKARDGAEGWIPAAYVTESSYENLLGREISPSEPSQAPSSVTLSDAHNQDKSTVSELLRRHSSKVQPRPVYATISRNSSQIEAVPPMLRKRDSVDDDLKQSDKTLPTRRYSKASVQDILESNSAVGHTSGAHVSTEFIRAAQNPLAVAAVSEPLSVPPSSVEAELATDANHVYSNDFYYDSGSEDEDTEVTGSLSQPKASLRTHPVVSKQPLYEIPAGDDAPLPSQSKHRVSESQSPSVQQTIKDSSTTEVLHAPRVSYDHVTVSSGLGMSKYNSESHMDDTKSIASSTQDTILFVAIHDYCGIGQAQDLMLSAGDAVTVTVKGDNGWWAGTCGSRAGTHTYTRAHHMYMMNLRATSWYCVQYLGHPC
jgi:hypothetical protein